MKAKQNSHKTINYDLDSGKITYEFLKSHLWAAADLLRGSLDASEYRQPVMTLLFLKRLNDTFEENAENLMKAPEKVIDYIIIHELSHFKIKGHSHKFWDYLHKFLPDYEDQINWLSINGSNILS